MNPRFRRILVVVLTLSAALITAGSAYSCDGRGSGPAVFTSFKAGHERGAHSVLAVTAAYLGVDRAALKSDLAAGKTLADIAPAGKTSAGLADAFAAAIKTKLDAKVAAGKLSPADEAALLAKIQPKLAAFAELLWTKHWTASDGRHHGKRHHGRH
jgi:hypothetical protein